MVGALLRLFMINLSIINTSQHTTAPSHAADSCRFVLLAMNCFPFTSTHLIHVEITEAVRVLVNILKEADQQQTFEHTLLLIVFHSH